MKFCIYGNPTVDFIEYSNGSKRIAYGGGSYYSSLPLLSRGVKPRIYSVYCSLLIEHPISVYIQKREYSTHCNIFVLRYHNDTRELGVLDTAPAISPWNIHEDNDCYVIVNPVIGEVNTSILKTLRTRSLLIALDIQGLLRRRVDTRIELWRNPEAIEALRYADIIHADAEELMILGNSRNLLESAEKLREKLRGVLITTIRPSTFILITQSRVEIIKAPNEYTARDRTGAGDYYLASYTLHYIEGNDPVESAYRAHSETTKWLKSREQKASSCAHHSAQFLTRHLM